MERRNMMAIDKFEWLVDKEKRQTFVYNYNKLRKKVEEEIKSRQGRLGNDTIILKVPPSENITLNNTRIGEEYAQLIDAILQFEDRTPYLARYINGDINTPNDNPDIYLVQEITNTSVP
jgi:hypothetical protein